MNMKMMKDKEFEKYERKVSRTLKKAKKLKKRRKLFSIAVPIAILVLMALVVGVYLGSGGNVGGQDDETPYGISEDELYEVVRVKDGDTILIDCDGEEVTVRLIGIDTPESVHPDEEQNTAKGEIASAYVKELLEGKSVSIEFDEEYYDRYDRVLAYVYLDGEMINELLLEMGYAKVTIYQPNDKYEDLFEGLEAVAKLKKVGFWEDGEW